MKEFKEITPSTKNIEIVYAGGTISSLVTPEGYREGGHAVDLVARLEARAPNLKEDFMIGNTSVAYRGLSENIDEEYWEKIEYFIRKALDRNPKTILVTHGTDSMEQTARRLKRTYGEELKKKKIKIVLTGANDDIDQPNTDAWDNLTFSIESANGDVESDVYVAFHRRLIQADLVVKEPFNGHEMSFVSKDDPDYIASIKIQEERDKGLIDKLQQSLGGNPNIQRVVEYPVNVVRVGNDEFIRQVYSQDIRAVVLILYHSGTANTEKSELSIASLVQKLRKERGIIFFGVTENGEPVNLHSYETSVRLREAGVIPLYNMPKNVALAKLQLVAFGTDRHIINEMLDNKVGEIDETQIIVGDIDTLKNLYSNT